MENRFNFRAYIKPYNKIYKVHSIEMSVNFLAIQCFKEDGETLLKRNDNETNLFLFKQDEFVLMQSTGFVDRNGKEIYEGDIVKILNFETKEDQLNIMKFYNGGFRAMSIWGKTDIDKARRDIFNTNPSHNENWDIEVIGNIYENKELLGEQ